MAFGSIYSGAAIKFGRRRALISASIAGMLGVGITTVMTFPTFIVGRFLYGVAVGMTSSVVSRMYEETIPVHLYSKCSPASMIACSTGTLLAFALGYILPHDNET